MTADFSGWATRNNLRCSDGRTILADAFAENDGTVVPLIWKHGHDDVKNILGHVKLENRSEGVWCDAFFNQTPEGLHAKEMIRHGDVKFLSIFANNLVEQMKDKVRNLKDVLKGNIREVSLVPAGANPGATVEAVNLAHGYADDGSDIFVMEEAMITTGEEIVLNTELAHADGDDRSAREILNTLDEQQQAAVYYLLAQALTDGSELQHSDTDPAPQDPVATPDPEDGAAPEADPEAAPEADEPAEPSPEADPADGEGADPEAEPEAAPAGDDSPQDADPVPAGGSDPEAGDADAVQHDNQEDNSMTHNVFDQSEKEQGRAHSATLSHDDVKAIVNDAVTNTGSLKRSLENHVVSNGLMVDGTLQHGIENLDYLFPDAKTLESSPAFISRRMEWVDKVLSGVRKSPFSRIKTITADITPDEARARGYIKGNFKNEEFFALSKRETTPQTIYKKQKLDRDDVIDITTLDVVAWLKAEMKVMLDEELAGAILVGDGRSIGDDDKIKETNIRPISTDAELYVTTVNVNLLDASSSVEELVDAVINNRQYYKGSGTPTFYTTEGTISKFLTVKDNFGRRIYSNLAEVAAVLRVSEIVPVEVMERDEDLIGIMVNLSDYTLGADRGGQATMFDDFDIDYNKLRYLIETRVSGALTQPKAALVFRSRVGTDVELAQPTEPTFDGETVTVPTVTNVTYKDGTGATLTTGAPVTLDPQEELDVQAFPAAGKYFPNDAQDQWHYKNEATS